MFVSIMINDSFKKGQSKEIFINIAQIAAIEFYQAGSYSGARVVFAASGNIASPIAAPAATEKYRRSYVEPFSYSISDAQGRALLAHIGTLKPVVNLSVDQTGNASPSGNAVAASVADEGPGAGW